MKRLALLLGLALALGSAVRAADVPRLAPVDASREVAAGTAVLVDVREAKDRAATGVAAPAALLAKSDFDGRQKLWAPFLATVGGKKIILYCRTGHQAGVVAAALAEKGYAVASAGSFQDWKDAGLPVRPADAPP